MSTPVCPNGNCAEKHDQDKRVYGIRANQSMRGTKTQSVIATLAASLLLLSGCAVTPTPLTRDELVEINQADRAIARKGVHEISGPISLEEAIARALKYNLDHRTRMMEQSLAVGQLEAGRFDMLPRLLLNAGYSWRDEENVREAEDSVTGEPSLTNPFISSSRKHATADLGLHWSIIDFGVGYYNAKENANRVLIAHERRRKAMHTLIQSVRTAFWRAAATEKLSLRIRQTIADAEVALENSRRISQEQIREPETSLRFQRNLLENLRLLENVDRELSIARIELAGLIGILPGTRFQLAEPANSEPGDLHMPVERMEEIALTNNADLREQHYNARNAALETRRALVKLLPNLSFNYGHNYDDDDFLIHNQWADAGIHVSSNLFNLLSGPSRMNAARMGVQVAEAKRMALQMSVLTQVHLARQQYDDALRQYRRADAIFQVDNDLTRLAVSREASQTSGRINRIAANVTSILSSVRRYHAMAKVHEAASRVQATLGQEPDIGSLDEITLEDLQDRIRKSMRFGGGVAAVDEQDPAISTDDTPAVFSDEQDSAVSTDGTPAVSGDEQESAVSADDTPAVSADEEEPGRRREQSS